MKKSKLALIVLVVVGLFIANEYSIHVERKCLEMGNTASQCAKLWF